MVVVVCMLGLIGKRAGYVDGHPLIYTCFYSSILYLIRPLLVQQEDFPVDSDGDVFRIEGRVTVWACHHS